MSFAWPDLHYNAGITLEFLQRYERLRDELKELQPDLYSDLPLREIPENPQVTADGKIERHIASYYLKTLLEDIDYILEIQSQLRRSHTPTSNQTADQNRGDSVPWDVFISHASEDKAAVAEPLAYALIKAGVSVWYDTIELKIGDSLRSSIDKGLRDSKFGIIVLSPAFFGKHWPELELNGLAQKEVNGEKVILPVWYNVTIDEVRSRSPLLADRIAAKWRDGMDSVITSLLDVIQPNPVHVRPEGAKVTPDSLKELAVVSPKTAMSETWTALATAISEAAKRNQSQIEYSEGMSPSEIVNQLFQASKISEEVREEFFRLKKWQESAALWHVHQEPADAVGFAELVNGLGRRFDAI
ncbi:MAG: toll/interleukin-1 receptor domain-containing protein [Pyrinomonadaceae bacterium]